MSKRELVSLNSSTLHNSLDFKPDISFLDVDSGNLYLDVERLQRIKTVGLIGPLSVEWFYGERSDFRPRVSGIGEAGLYDELDRHIGIGDARREGPPSVTIGISRHSIEKRIDKRQQDGITREAACSAELDWSLRTGLYDWTRKDSNTLFVTLGNAVGVTARMWGILVAPEHFKADDAIKRLKRAREYLYAEHGGARFRPDRIVRTGLHIAKRGLITNVATEHSLGRGNI